jgi:monovalent cation:H+ antiporter-2, CPA2 family
MTDAALDAYKEPILFLVTAGVIVPLFHRLRISPVLGFIGAGVLLGPYGLGRLTGAHPWLAHVTIANREEFAHLAELGVIFLMFMIGVELSFERLRTLRRLVFGLGSLQVVVSALILDAILVALGAPPAAATLVALALALSSTAIVIPVLAERRRLNSATGRGTFAVLLFQDLAVAPILFAIAVLAKSDAADAGSALALAIGQAVVALAVIVGAGRLALRPLFQLVARTKSPELFMAACLLVIAATALVSAAAGLSTTLGAFIAGLLLAETEYRRAIEATIDPFKGLLLGVFFVSVGMNLDPAQLLAAPLTILALALGLILVKGGVILALAPRLGLSRPVAAESALLLGPGGEFAFVLIGSATAAGLVPEGLGSAALIVTTVTMITIPLLAAVGQRLGSRTSRADLGRARAEPQPDRQAGLRARRTPRRRDAQAPRHPLPRPRLGPRAGRRAAPARQPRLLRRFGEPGAPAPLRRRERAGPRRDARHPERGRGGDRRRARRARRPHHRRPRARRAPRRRPLRARRGRRCP